MTPLGYLEAAGERAQAVLPLTWLTLAISIAVCIIIGILLWLGVRRAASNGGAAETRAIPIDRGSSGVRWIGIGIAISAVPLLVTLVWTMVALADVSGPPAHPGLTLDITAHQWWWEVRYDAAEPDHTFATANEIHIPVGERVLVRLHGGDVIHSFWVPKLTGKTDTIPGQTNLSWMQASRAGRYSGQCTEYCGLQHSHMGFLVVAQPAGDFRKWWDHQLTSTAVPTGHAQLGQADFQMHCGNCHTVRGTEAAGALGPDLSHLMQRSTIAAGQLPNNGPVLAHWIADPQSLKPGSLMPAPSLSETELADIHAYLKTLD